MAGVIVLSNIHVNEEDQKQHSAIGLLHKLLNIKALILESFGLFLVLRAMTMNIVHLPRLRSPVTIQLLLELSQACTYIPLTIAHIFKDLILFACLGVLICSTRLPPLQLLSNLPVSLCIEDVFNHPRAFYFSLMVNPHSFTNRPTIFPPVCLAITI